MSNSFYFYDLETSGFNPRDARIMQFAGQRTDINLNPIGEPHNLFIAFCEDSVPEPDAVLVTGITPQETISSGITEFEFLKLFHGEIAIPDTIFVGFNNVRFDDEFLRYLHYRNFYDPYEWHWQEGRSRWDLLDLVRMARALRPEGIKWPFDSHGNASNTLELLTSANGLKHNKAHDALSDVVACIELAGLIKKKQPKLFDYLLEMRTKKAISEFIRSNPMFLYTSGKYPSEYEKTTIVTVIADNSERQGKLVYDLRYDPQPFDGLSPAELAEIWRRRSDDNRPLLPVKSLMFNRCPALAPLSVLSTEAAKRLKLNMKDIKSNLTKLRKTNLPETLPHALDILNKRQQTAFITDEIEADQRLYEDFFPEQDKTKMSIIRAADETELANLDVTFKDARLQALLPLYKARNFPKLLSEEERAIWDQFRQRRLLGGKDSGRLAKYFARIKELQARPDFSTEQTFLLEELILWGEAIIPTE